MGMALIGDPAILIMDEPTSGMDPVSRRGLWDIIKDLKRQGKTLLMCTQFLDEADELGDRVAVLCKGQFFAIGSVDFMKKNFGVGYHLIVSSKMENVKISGMEIRALIQEIVPTAYEHHQAGGENIEYILPFNQIQNFGALFARLEAMEDLQVIF